MKHQLGKSDRQIVYKKGGILGTGTFGKVYEASIGNKSVAMKYIQKDRRNRKVERDFLHQLEINLNLKHPNIIEVIQSFETENDYVIIMEKGQKRLLDLLKQKKRLSQDEIRKYGRQIMDGLVFLKQNKITHRDLKPQNILLANDHIKICDFGLSKKVLSSIDVLHSIKGTPLYIAPQIISRRAYDFKVDIWSFGVILYQMATGRPAFSAQDLQGLYKKIIYSKPRYPPYISAQLQDLLQGMMQKKPQYRFDWQKIKQHPFFHKKAKMPKLQEQEQTGKQFIKYQQPIENFPAKRYFDQQKEYASPPMKKLERVKSADPTTKKVGEIVYNGEFFYMSPKKHNSQNKQQKKFIELSQILQMSSYYQCFKEIEKNMKTARLQASKLKVSKQLKNKIQSFLKQIEFLPSQAESTTQEISKIISYLLSANLNDQEDQQNILKDVFFLEKIIETIKAKVSPRIKQELLRSIGDIMKKNYIQSNMTQIDLELLMLNIDSIDHILKSYPINANEQKNLKFTQQKDMLDTCIITLGILINLAFQFVQTSEPFFNLLNQKQIVSTLTSFYHISKLKANLLQIFSMIIHPMNKNAPKINGNLFLIFYKMKKSFSESFLRYLPKTVLLGQDANSYYINTKDFAKEVDITYECLLLQEKAREYFFNSNQWQEYYKKEELRTKILALNNILVDYNKNIRKFNSSIISQSSIKKPNQLQQVFLLRLQCLGVLQEPNNNEKINKLQKIVKRIQTCFSSINASKKLQICQKIEGLLKPTYNLFDTTLVQTLLQTFSELNKINSQQAKRLLNQIINNIPKYLKVYENQVFKQRSKILSIAPFTLCYLCKNCYNQSDALKESQQFALTVYKFMENMIEQGLFEYYMVAYGSKKDPYSFVRRLIMIMLKILGNASKFKSIQTSMANKFQQRQFIQIFNEDFFKQSVSVIQSSLVQINKYLPLVKNSSETLSYLAVNVLPYVSQYIGKQQNEKNFNLQYQILNLVCFLALGSTKFNDNIIQAKILDHMPSFLVSQSQKIQSKALHTLGVLVKNSPDFMEIIKKLKIISSIKKCIQNNYQKNQKKGLDKKILRYFVYVIGNMAHWKGYLREQLQDLTFYLYFGLTQNDFYTAKNTILTIYNLVKHNSFFLQNLIKHKIIEELTKMALKQNNDQELIREIRPVMQKLLNYSEMLPPTIKSQINRFISRYSPKEKSKLSDINSPRANRYQNP